MLPLSNYKIHYREQIGSGSFGSVYVAEDPTGSIIAVKKEPITIRAPQLFNEVNVYNEIKGGVGIADIKCWGTQGKYNILVMDYLGKSLQDLFNLNPFNLKTVLMIANQILCRLEYLHKRNFLHRDVKPDNFLTGRQSKANILYMIDFGLSKKYRDPKTNIHNPIEYGKALTGSTRFASLNNHSGIEYSRRDDLESLAYILIYFMKGKLPWQGIEAANLETLNEKVYHIKKNTQIKQLCYGLPLEFGTFLSSVRNLEYDEEPKYSDYRKMFIDLMLKFDLCFDGMFTWIRVKAATSIDHINRKKVMQTASAHSGIHLKSSKLQLPKIEDKKQRRNSILKMRPKVVIPLQKKILLWK
ncbi:Casein kinase I isoform epsilon [Tritrichomonas foetus]|uniref:non-specific serine/threonine protein kinase n=1 Tax=Tritrichomonas foetus TaxID=1144522 RepID=A0A1J4JST7_9EUKA|nr:Casein kinase I isoform epsilon [Tritrichomonas foetus]|eukprot:OHT02123.1 Casein kinase I isoform epsilon [Tritrichomonas foetus]